MPPLREAFDERVEEVRTYLDFLDNVEGAFLESVNSHIWPKITAPQQRILYSSVYLQLYNLVEATVTHCLAAVCTATQDRYHPSELSDNLRREWVRQKARTHLPSNPETRLEDALGLARTLIAPEPLSKWKIEVGGGGNWDEQEIDDIARRLDCTMQVPSHLKRFIANDKRALSVVKDRRNRLAHGGLSFSECGASATARDLRTLADITISYMSAVVDAFQSYLACQGFLVPEQRRSNP